LLPRKRLLLPPPRPRHHLLLIHRHPSNNITASTNAFRMDLRWSGQEGSDTLRTYFTSIGLFFITIAMTDVLQTKDAISDNDLCHLLHQEPLALVILRIGSLHIFMHRPDCRYCECMQDVATAAGIGRVSSRDMKIKTDRQHGAVCHAAQAKSKVYSLFCKKSLTVARSVRSSIGQESAQEGICRTSKAHSQ